MYIKHDGQTFYRGTAQHHSRGAFLILMQSEDRSDEPMRAVIRKVALEQLGPWMMGKARVFGHSVMISGAYGDDGGPRTVPAKVYDKAIPLPAHLIKAWNEGEGWNGAGKEAEAMRKWALENEKELSPK